MCIRDQGHVVRLPAEIEQLPEARAELRRRRDELGGHQRTPCERPALLEAREEAGERAREQDVADPGPPARAEDLPDAQEERRDPVDPGEQPVDDRGDGAQQDDREDRGVAQLEPDAVSYTHLTLPTIY